MANFLDGIINRFKLPDEEAESYEEEYEYEEQERQREEEAAASARRRQRQTQSLAFAAGGDNDVYDEDDREPQYRRRKPQRTSRKVVPITGGGTKVRMSISMEKPKSFNDTGDISDKLIAGSTVVLNLQGLDPGVAQRIIDFMFGVMHAINGKYSQIADYVFVFSPEDVELAGEVSDLLTQNGLEVPVINKDF